MAAARRISGSVNNESFGDCDRHESWLADHEKRIRENEIAMANLRGKSIVYMALASAVASAVMSGIVSIGVVLFLGLIK